MSAASNNANVDVALNAAALTFSEWGVRQRGLWRGHHHIQQFTTAAEVVPEPGTFALLGAALSVLYFARKRVSWRSS